MKKILISLSLLILSTTFLFAQTSLVRADSVITPIFQSGDYKLYVANPSTGLEIRLRPWTGGIGIRLVTNNVLNLWQGSTNINKLGTITAGTWQGTAIADLYINSAGTWNGKQNALSGTGYPKLSGSSISYIASIPDADISSAVTWNAKQNQLSGIGLPRFNGTSVTYDNTNYLPVSTVSGVPAGRLIYGTATSALGNVADLYYSSSTLYTPAVNTTNVTASGTGTFGVNVGIGITSPNGLLQFSNGNNNRKIVLYEQANDDHQFDGIGYNTGEMRYQGHSGGVDHVWNSGGFSGSAYSVEVARIKGTGGFSTSGTGTFGTNAVVNGGGTSYFNGGNLAIGSTTASYPLHITVASGTLTGLTRTGTGTYLTSIEPVATSSTADYVIRGQQASSGFVFESRNASNTAISAVFTRDGRFGVNTTNPTTQAEILGSTGLLVANHGNANSNNGGSYLSRTYAGNPFQVMEIFAANTQNLFRIGGGNAGREAANVFTFYTTQGQGVLGAGQERMRLTETGRLGIGTATPLGKLSIYQPTAGEGTVTNLAGGTTVTGTLTEFTNSFASGKGQTIVINGETVTVVTVVSGTSITVSPALVNANTNVAYTIPAARPVMNVFGNGNTSFGGTTSAYTVDVVGNIRAQQVNVTGSGTLAYGTAAGTTPTAVSSEFYGSNGFEFSFTAGASPAANATLATYTYPIAYVTNSTCTISAENTNAKNQYSQITISANTTTVTISNANAMVNGQTYTYSVTCFGK